MFDISLQEHIENDKKKINETKIWLFESTARLWGCKDYEDIINEEAP